MLCGRYIIDILTSLNEVFDAYNLAYDALFELFLSQRFRGFYAQAQLFSILKTAYFESYPLFLASTQLTTCCI